MLNTVTASLSKRLFLMLMCACALAQAQAQAQTMQGGARIGWVSTERLFTESKQAMAADAKIEAEFSKRQKAMQEQIAYFKTLSEKFDYDAPTLSEPERTRRTREMIDLDKDLQRKQREFREDLMQRKNEERANISQMVRKLIQQIAEQEKLDIVLQESVWFSPRIDITDRLLKQMDK
jgi:outer membrane protein